MSLNQNNTNKLIELRKKLHQNPELSGMEKNTAEKLRQFITKFSPTKIVSDFGGNGLLVQFIGSNHGTHVMLRSELDALPIQENNDFAHRSFIDGVSHKCGHDGHSTILVGVASYFSENPLKKGILSLLFQPAEEIGEGAKAILTDSRWKEFEPDYIVALHNVPGFPMHSIVCKKGEFTPAVKSIIIKLDGKTSHAAEPEKGINPAIAVSKIINAAQDLESPVYNEELKLITAIQIELGEEAYGISAGNATMKFTLRAWTDEILDKLSADFVAKIKEISAVEQLNPTIDWTQFFSANVNNDILLKEIETAAQKNKYAVIKQEFPFKWGEDFGLFTQKYKGALFGLGAGVDSPALHNPDYDFPDDLIETGVNMFVTIIHQITEK